MFAMRKLFLVSVVDIFICRFMQKGNRSIIENQFLKGYLLFLCFLKYNYKLIDPKKYSVLENGFYSISDEKKNKLGNTGIFSTWILFDPLIVIIHKAMPLVELRSVRVSGSTYQVPVEMCYKRQFFMAIKWICIEVNMRKEKSFPKKLCNELCDILNESVGNLTLKRKSGLHLLVETNRAFAQLRW